MGRSRMLALRSDKRVIDLSGTSSGIIDIPAGVVVADSYYVPFQQENTTYIESHEIGLHANNSIVTWGANRGGIFNPPPGLSIVAGISAGYSFNAAVLGGPTILLQPRDARSGVGTLATFEVRASSRSLLRYQW